MRSSTKAQHIGPSAWVFHALAPACVLRELFPPLPQDPRVPFSLPASLQFLCAFWQTPPCMVSILLSDAKAELFWKASRGQSSWDGFSAWQNKKGKHTIAAAGRLNLWKLVIFYGFIKYTHRWFKALQSNLCLFRCFCATLVPLGFIPSLFRGLSCLSTICKLCSLLSAISWKTSCLNWNKRRVQPGFKRLQFGLGLFFGLSFNLSVRRGLRRRGFFLGPFFGLCLGFLDKPPLRGSEFEPDQDVCLPGCERGVGTPQSFCLRPGTAIIDMHGANWQFPHVQSFVLSIQRCENNSKHLGQVAHAITAIEGQSIKHQYHSIGKQRHVWSRSEFDTAGPACSSGASRKGPCRQGCNLTASQHSFEMSFLRMAVAMPHLVLHKKDQMMWSLDV